MKVAKIYDFEDLRIEDAERPQPGPRDILVQVKASGICSGDVTPWYIKRKAPIVLGHEPAGVVVEIGDEVTNFAVGDRVFVHHHAPCFTCRYCERGEFVQCKTWKASKIVPGGISEYFLVPETNLGDTLKLPDTVSFEDGALVEPAACSVKAVRKARVGQVICADLVDWRCEKALEFGADAVINPTREDLVERLAELTDGALADVVIVGPAVTKVMELGVKCAGKGGVVLIFMGSPPEDMMTINPFHLYFNEIDLVMSYSCGPDDTREALRLIESGVLTAEKLVTHRYELNDTYEGFKKMAEARDVLKAQIIFP